jgi:hypothetical protein
VLRDVGLDLDVSATTRHHTTRRDKILNIREMPPPP